MVGTFQLRQTRDADGALMCLAAAAWSLGFYNDISKLREPAVTSTCAGGEAELARLASLMGLDLQPVTCPSQDIRKRSFPIIVQSGINEGYLLITRVFLSRARIYDPARGWRWMPAEELENRGSDVTYEVSVASSFEKRSSFRTIKATHLLSPSRDVRKAVIKALALTAFMQLGLLLSPLYMRVVVDEVVVDQSVELLNAITLGIVMLYAFNAIASMLRGIVIQQLNSLLSWDMSRRVVGHLLRLPLAWFQQRRLADVMNRAQGIDQVRSATTNCITAAFDGLYCIGALGMLLGISPLIAGLAILGLILYVAVRSFAMPLSQRLSELNAIASVSEQQKRMENVRAIQTIKVMGAEILRENAWSSRFATALRVTQENVITNLLFSTVQGFFNSLISVSIIYVGALLVMRGQMTIGLLTAALAYQGQFSQRSANLFDQIVAWRMLKVPLERVSDIVLAEREASVGLPGDAPIPLRGELEARNLCFRYTTSGPRVVDDLNLRVAAGEHVAITGPSGIGKSTLIKLLCGLYMPSAGELLIDGRPIEAWGGGRLRRSLGIVLQDDVLLEGSIADNISFFAQNVDRNWIWECLALAGIDAEVRAMPASVDSTIGDLGQAVSGGQKQRLLLARALYMRPRILLLDEATSHLDPARERAIVAAFKCMNTTQIVVAHRAETIAAADRVLSFYNGKLTG